MIPNYTIDKFLQCQLAIDTLLGAIPLEYRPIVKHLIIMAKSKQKTCRKLSRQIAQRKEQNAKLRNSLSKLQKQLHDLELEYQKLQQEFENFKRQVKAFLDELFSKLNVNSRNSNKPPSADSPYHKFNLDNLVNKYNLNDITITPDGSDSPTDQPNSPEDPDAGSSGSEPNDSDSPTDGAPNGENGSSPDPDENSGSNEPSPDDDKKKKPKKKPRKAHHPGKAQELYPPTEVIKLLPKECPYCHCDEFIDFRSKSIHQYIDLVEKLVDILHFEIFEGTCANCGRIVCGKVPPEYKNLRFGPRFHSLIAWLNSSGGVTRRNLEAFSEDFLGVPLSQGGAQKILNRVSKAILSHYDLIAEGARKHWYNHMDETSCPTFGPRGKHTHWLWAMCNDSYAFFKIEEHRSKKAFFIVIGPWRGILISDDYRTYIKWENGRQTCIAHLLRAAKKVAESRNPKVAKCGKWIRKTLKEYCKMQGNILKPEEIKKLKEEFLTKAKEFEGIGEDGETLLNRLIAEFDAVTYFLRYPLPPTNNAIEQLIRAFVVVRKVSFGTTSEVGERWLERQLSLRMTCRLRGISYAKTLQKAVTAALLKQPIDLTWLTECVSKPNEADMQQSATA